MLLWLVPEQNLRRSARGDEHHWAMT